jgi:hypothetical protein
MRRGAAAARRENEVRRSEKPECHLQNRGAAILSKPIFSGMRMQMRRRTGLGFAWLFLFYVTLVHAQNPFDSFQQFSASASGGPFKWDKMKIYRSGKQMRGDYVYENEVRISNLADKKGWYIRPRDWVSKPKECGRMALWDMSAYPFLAYSDGNFDVERLPTTETAERETLDGHSCKVENYTVTPKDGRSIKIKMKLWEAEDLNGFPIQMEITPSSLPPSKYNYTDVSVDRPDPKLFQLPALCRSGVSGKKKRPATAPKTPNKTSPKSQ